MRKDGWPVWQKTRARNDWIPRWRLIRGEWQKNVMPTPHIRAGTEAGTLLAFFGAYSLVLLQRIQHLLHMRIEYEVAYRLTCIYLIAEPSMERFEHFLSSGVAGSCLLRSSKHSLRCALLFFSSLLWTSRVPARGALPLLPLLLLTEGGEGICVGLGDKMRL